jgi:multidrug efflux system membrane fusion protein
MPDINWTAMRRRLSIVLGTIAALALAGAGCNRGGGGMPPMMQRPPPGVVVVPVTIGNVPIYLDEIGKAVALQTVAIQPQVTGQITDIAFTDGQIVKKGDLLFKIDPRPYQATLNQAKATLDQDQQKANFAKLDYSMVQNAGNALGAVSREDFETKKNALAVAEAQIKVDEAAVETAAVNLAYCTITSPIDGRVGQHQFDLGTVVMGNGFVTNSLVTVETLDPIYVDFTVPEPSLTQVRDAMAAVPGGALKVIVSVPGQESRSKEGTLTFLDNSVQPATGTVKLRATLPNPEYYFWPGQFVNVRLILKTINGAILVPSEAEQFSQTGPFIYTVDKDNKTELRPIKPGQRQGEMLVIESGVNPDDRVVAQGQLMIQGPGQPVTVLPNAPTTTSAPASTMPGS